MIYTLLLLSFIVIPFIVLFFNKELAGFLAVLNTLLALTYLSSSNESLALAPNESGSVIVGMHFIYFFAPIVINIIIILVCLLVIRRRY